MRVSVKESIGITHLLDAQDLAGTDTKTKLLDLKDFSSSAILINFGALTGTGSILAKLQESNTTADVDFTDVNTVDLIGAFVSVTSSTDNISQIVGYKGTKRYIRAVITKDGTVTADLVSCDGIVGEGRREPVTAPAAVSAT
ncbi:MAG: hypothetical protein GX869_07525 [Candidatus Cloacimonetes bacterium]|nr:hypothetical protein [Candidatus Cloacimonadota bacterium]